MEEIFKKFLEVVSNFTELDCNELINSNKEDCVNARAILINLLSEAGFTDTMISKHSGMTRQGVNKLKNSFIYRKRQSFVLSINYQRIRSELATNKLISNV